MRQPDPCPFRSFVAIIQCKTTVAEAAPVLLNDLLATFSRIPRLATAFLWPAA